MKYRVVSKFRDLQDNNHVYEQGDWYPRRGEVSPERVEELASVNNAMGRVLIEKVEGEQVPPSVDLSKKVDEVIADISEGLAKLLTEESADKNRKGVTEYLENLLKVGD